MAMPFCLFNSLAGHVIDRLKITTHGNSDCHFPLHLNKRDRPLSSAKPRSVKSRILKMQTFLYFRFLDWLGVLRCNAKRLFEKLWMYLNAGKNHILFMCLPFLVVSP
jgi:hypothetical protein